MKTWPAVVLAVVLAAAIALPLVGTTLPPLPASPEHMRHTRDVAVGEAGKQNYVVADEALWRGSEARLNDVRLYAGTDEIPYSRHDGAEPSAAELPATMLNLSKVGDRAQFILAVPVGAEYNRVNIQLADGVANFVSRVAVEGTDDDSFARWAKIGEYTLYDFSREDLGRNTTLRLPLLRYRYLFVKVFGRRPEQITGATVGRRAEAKAEWTVISPPGGSEAVKIEQAGRETVITVPAHPNLTLRRLRFRVAGEGNFYRTVKVDSIAEEGESATITTGFLRRITLQRSGRTIREEDLDLPLGHSAASSFRVTIQNGDDPPLPIESVQSLVSEVRFYFDPRGNGTLKLMYGDPRAGAPEYDYARTASPQPDAPRAELGPATANPIYKPRPDTRPWTERHPWLLWVTLVLVVLVLGVFALRTMKTTPA